MSPPSISWGRTTERTTTGQAREPARGQQPAAAGQHQHLASDSRSVGPRPISSRAASQRPAGYLTCDLSRPRPGPSLSRARDTVSRYLAIPHTHTHTHVHVYIDTYTYIAGISVAANQHASSRRHLFAKRTHTHTRFSQTHAPSPSPGRGKPAGCMILNQLPSGLNK